MKILISIILGIVISFPVFAQDECGVPPGVLKQAEKDFYKAAQVTVFKR